MPTLFLSGGECVWRGGVEEGDSGVEGDREAAGSRNGCTETERERGMDAAVCACQRQGYPLGDLRPQHCHFGYHGDTVNEHMHR